MFLVGVLILSDACFQDPLLDATTAAVETAFAGAKHNYTVTSKAIIPDDFDAIQSKIIGWSAKPGLDLILTCGGTGFTDRDITPEAIRPLLHREAPGIVHQLLSESLKITPYAIMSRPVAGVRNQSVVITLPGSPKAAVENLQAVLGVLGHALAQIGLTDSRALHQKFNRTINDALPDSDSSPVVHPVPSDALATLHSSSLHHCPHGHTKPSCGISKHKLVSNDLSSPVTLRARALPFPMLPVPEALALIAKFTPAPTKITKRITDDLAGYILAEDVFASVDVPSFPASIVDGYAVVSADGTGTYPVVAVSHANASEKTTLRPGEIARITTGAPVPLGADAVVMVEETELITTDGTEEKEVKILAIGVKPLDNVRAVGSDIQKGTKILAKGTPFASNGSEVGVLASVGVTHVAVFAKPTVGVLSTGNELLDLKTFTGEVKYGQIFDSNRPTLLSAVKNSHFAAVDLGIAVDRAESLEEVIREAFAQCDILITTGGVSMGELDLLKPVIERKLGGVIHFGRVAMKPGKPTTFATVEIGGFTKIIFGLPGNPASASVTFNLFVLPSMMKNAGYEQSGVATVDVELTQDIRLDPRPEYHRVYVFQKYDEVTKLHKLVAESTGFQRSSRIGSMKGANGLLCLPSSKTAGSVLRAGEHVKAMLIDSLRN
ncbi:hypothetical protein BABINDRAFT_160057 [Babjeviella inositovora NRRL Y-12698]|uniref:MoaB/Mog domain-containing protein n=1 Tax=Babjeviella inositovora NRRL Y-12698 TaxID=984486 RepID=A0A1E3QW25_9ASCO|nr:uncharacterized protein BABINDRAFT_160057 [Babjeviella inositovora NRRL Y-12698]ODQ81821.1 hypothetical protein BABINDRAFT_160057 [Babjeviella inositovora NRRL Y-12698]